MKLLQKLSAGFLLSFGFIFLLVSVSAVFDKNSDEKDKNSAFFGGLALGVPFIAGGGAILWGLHRDSRKKLLAQTQEEEERLRTIFFNMLDREKGKVTVLRLAMEAKISGDAARHYLDLKAKEFDTTFEVGEQGEITYQFNI
jgi:hypothetical protein